jgi:multidrug efflux pump subunit AcrB
MTDSKLRISGRLAHLFQASQITPLLALVCFLLGVFAVLVTPREEEPQINVTMANVLIPFPGASVKDVEQMVSGPAEQVLSQITGVDHVMSVSQPGMSVVTVQYKVGVPRTEALVRLYDTVNSHADWLPKGLGVMQPLIKPKGIDDVPILSLTLHGKERDLSAFELEGIAQNIEIDLKRVKGTREVTTVGGPSRAIQIDIDPARMQAAGITVPELRMALQGAHLGAPVGDLLVGQQAIAIESGPFLSNAKDVASLVVGVRAGTPIHVHDIAQVRDGGAQANTAVWHGVAGEKPHERTAVTVAITKKPGENAIEVAHAVLAQVESLKHSKIPADVDVTTTRNYGETANDKAQKLIQKLLFATASVVALVFIALGRREAAIVGTAVILTLTVTLFASWAWGFTLNRVSLFALIFSIVTKPCIHTKPSRKSFLERSMKWAPPPSWPRSP